MNTTAARSLAQPSTKLNVRKVVLYVNGAFLTLMGGPFAIFDLLSYFWGIGPLGATFHHVGNTVGLFEAHGLAFILGLLLLRAARWEPVARWHLLGAGIHLLLGTSNLLFWSFIVAMDAVTAEIVITAIHWLFFGLQLVCFALAKQTDKRWSGAGRSGRHD